MKKCGFIHSTLLVEFLLFAETVLSIRELFRSEQNTVLVLVELKF